ncbi:haloacid dehalogenase [Nocardioides sp. Root122]|jgi:trehalose 6-phosphate phosphatase|uniref:trehalose-phosphatase n=1 Tax=Nocardioides TaxID=1839 RepID=UPI0007034109|nr:MULTISPECIES: trehalose-phosphatase [Nocardioides]KQV71720.1 haloacid dehalogenase [Nocardioides sp. Root122]MCK9825719.1 trehalose-phosphatase [Nocardioides cavernae]
MEFTSAAAREHYDAVRDVLDGVVIGLDFDGTLSPVVDDPEAARLHPAAPGVLLELAEVVRAVAVITGRPARQAIAMGDLDALGNAMLDRGAELFVFGQYGNERWSATEQRILSPRPPAGLASFERELPGVLRRAGAADAYIEEKGLAVAVHTRRMEDPAAAFERIVAPLAELAERHHLALEPGRNVVEIRSAEMHKGQAVRTFVEEQQAKGVVFGGDDLGDIEAFEAVRDLREQGLPGLVICSASTEQPALVDLADLVVDGPPGVVEALGGLLRQG